MTTFQVCDRVGELVARRPALSRYFEQQGIDYCCGGKKTLREVCQEKGLDSRLLLDQLEDAASAPLQQPMVDAAAMTLTDLADHIEQTHHAYLRREFERLDRMTNKVANAHGANDPRLHRVRDTFLALVDELSCHMLKEEQILFPLIRRMERSDGPIAFHCGSIANPIRQMEMEHQDAGDALAKLRELTDNYAPPDWACNTYRAMLDALAQLELDMHQHVHKEDNVLFPKALVLEATLAAGGVPERAHVSH
jgi:regulator of cell morphogenesis and NO signaling